MKNLLIYINPEGFDKESKELIKLQIDNSFELGWKKEDIILITDFPYEYKSIKAKVISGTFCSFYTEASKIYAIIRMFKLNLIEDNMLYWFHDLDAYQLEPITEEELELDGFDLGLTDYGRKPNWNTGSFFFKKNSRDIFIESSKRIGPGLDKNRRIKNSENSIEGMTNENWQGINSRIKRMNYTYNFGMRKVKLCYEIANKPLKVLHFHFRSKLLNTLAIAMYGRNEIKKPLMNQRLIKLFKKYGIT